MVINIFNGKLEKIDARKISTQAQQEKRDIGDEIERCGYEKY